MFLFYLFYLLNHFLRIQQQTYTICNSSSIHFKIKHKLIYRKKKINFIIIWYLKKKETSLAKAKNPARVTLNLYKSCRFPHPLHSYLLFFFLSV